MDQWSLRRSCRGKIRSCSTTLATGCTYKSRGIVVSSVQAVAAIANDESLGAKGSPPRREVISAPFGTQRCQSGVCPNFEMRQCPSVAPLCLLDWRADRRLTCFTRALRATGQCFATGPPAVSAAPPLGVDKTRRSAASSSSPTSPACSAEKGVEEASTSQTTAKPRAQEPLAVKSKAAKPADYLHGRVTEQGMIDAIQSRITHTAAF